jgi:hypothetical protein
MSNVGQFDPANFLDMQMTEASSTVSTPVPEGEYTGIVDGEPEIRQWTGKKDPTKSGLVLDITWLIDDATVKAELGREKVTCRQSIMLDLNSNGGIDTGKGRNVSLGRLRDAVNLNEPGKPFSFRMLAGQCAKVAIKHRVDGDAVYAEVKGVARL